MHRELLFNLSKCLTDGLSCLRALSMLFLLKEVDCELRHTKRLSARLNSIVCKVQAE